MFTFDIAPLRSMADQCPASKIGEGEEEQEIPEQKYECKSNTHLPCHDNNIHTNFNLLVDLIQIG